MLTLFTKNSRPDFSFTIQYDGYCYYINGVVYLGSFIFTKETDKYIMGDLYYRQLNYTYPLIYDKSCNIWCRYNHGKLLINSVNDNKFYNKIKGVLYVMQYRRMMTNLYYLFHHIDLLPDIYTHINKLMSDIFPKDTFTIL